MVDLIDVRVEVPWAGGIESVDRKERRIYDAGHPIPLNAALVIVTHPSLSPLRHA